MIGEIGQIFGPQILTKWFPHAESDGENLLHGVSKRHLQNDFHTPIPGVRGDEEPTTRGFNLMHCRKGAIHPLPAVMVK